MFIAAVILSTLVLLGLAIQVYQSVDLSRRFQYCESAEVADNELPSCAVVLSLRGCDPGLERTLESLFSQNYPQYELFVVFDNVADPAIAVVSEIVDRTKPTNVTLRIVEEHLPTCSLVANNLASILPELADRFELIAWVDADAATWPDWLRTLVAPLVSFELTVVYGNRWYMPKRKSFATLARFIWNYGSVQQMVFFNYPWAGSLAMKSSFIHETDYVDILRTSITNDTQIFPIAQKAGMCVGFNPNMMLVNQEDIGFADFFYWMCRQLIYGRLYHPTWPLVLGTGIATGLVIGGAMIVNLINLIQGNWGSLGILTGSLMLFWFVWLYFVFQLDKQVGAMVAERGEPRRWWSWMTAVAIFFVAPFVQFIFLAALFKATFMKVATWRGIDYEINGPFDIKMKKYKPYLISDSRTQNESIL